MFLPDISLNTGSTDHTNNNESKLAIAVYKKASTKNCRINCNLKEPNTFLIPISLLLLTDCAVLD